MGTKKTYILGIESSCDDTAAAVISDSVILSNVVASQSIHELYGGVVPELASREHQKLILPVVNKVLKEAGISVNDLSAVAFTNGPGLVGSLMVGTSFAKSMSLALDIPLIAISSLKEFSLNLLLINSKYTHSNLIFNKRFFFIFITFLIFSNLKAQESSIFDIARNGTLIELKQIIKTDADIINLISKNGYSALTLACYYGNNEVATFLVRHVKDLNSKSSYGTPLMAATVKKNIYLVKLLLENNANPNLTDKNNSTALHFSVIFSQEKIIKLLVKYQAKSNIKDNRGNTALDYAKIINNIKIIQLLK